MRKLLWIGVGISLTIYVTRRWRRLTETQPALKVAVDATHSARQATELGRGFLGDVRSAMDSREHELRSSLLGQ